MTTVHTSHDVDRITGVLTEAFSDDPVISWVFPRALAERERWIAGFMGTWVGFMLEKCEGTAFVTGNGDGVLVLEPSERPALSLRDEAAFQQAVAEATGPAADRCRDLMRLLDEHYPKGLAPHYHAALAGVRPHAQGQGTSLALAEEGFRLADAHHMDVYCEASSPRNAARWRRLGFADIGEPITLPDTTIALRPLYTARHSGSPTREAHPR